MMDTQSVKQKLGIIGRSEGFDRAIEVALRVAPTDLSVLVTGESGAGKEFFPQIIHNYSARKHNNYIAVNCGAIPEGTIDSELFGHEKGSFTGANSERKGYFEQADGGTIFLDEVAELPLTTQVRLLRVLQTGEFIRVGSSKVIKTDVRVVAATNINLPNAIMAGRFREDLFYRLNTVPITVPPLRDRRQDITLLFRRFAADIASQYRMPVISLLPDAREMLRSYRWPGNVRQLKNVAEQISAVETRREIDSELLSHYLPNVEQSSLPVLMRGSQGAGAAENSAERDILYKLIFEMRDELTQLRGVVAELSKEVGVGTTFESRHNVLLAENTSHRNMLSEEFTPVEDISVDEQEETVLPRTKNEQQKALIEVALAKHRGRRKEAAAELFMSERTLYRKIKELGIE
ncbi:MAG: sigma-54 dependent transcriptional regulator [Rikenellaceae bacterium]